MGRNLNLVLHREIENLDKHPDSRRDAMKTLKSYVKELDSKTIPIFLARISEVKEFGSASGECIISLFEVLARSQGCNIVPHMDSIMDTVMKTLSSSASSFALHQACSKVVNAIARYGIDPLEPESEKTRIICSLSKPLSDVLMDLQESTASGAALCLTALVESANWRFASDDVVNEICLRVAGAFQETRIQTHSHMGLVMSLLKHNSLVVDAYARSLLRSGSQILTSCVEERNSQKRLLAIQMINFLMKCVDSRSISSEFPSIIDVLERCMNDLMPFVRDAAFEALQTAKIIAGQKASQYRVSSSQVRSLNFEQRTDSRNSQTIRRGIAELVNTSCPEFSSPELQSVDSLVDFDAFVESSPSTGQSSCSFECGRQGTGRLWNNDAGDADDLSDQAGSRHDVSLVHSEGFRETELFETHKECALTYGSLQPTARNGLMNSSNPSPQKSRPQLVDNDANMYSTPHKLIQSSQNSDTNSRRLERRRWMLRNPIPAEVGWNQDNHSHNTNHEVQGRSNDSIGRPSMQLVVRDAVPVTDRADFAPEVGSCTAFCSTGCEDDSTVQMAKICRRRFGKAVVSFICCLLIAIIAIINVSYDSDEIGAFHVVPT